MNLIFTLELNHDPVFNQQIGTKSTFQFYTVINQRHSFLLSHAYTLLPEFIGKAGLISRFEQPGPQSAVDFYGCSNDSVRQLIRRKAPRALLRTRSSSWR